VIDPLERWPEYGEKPDYAGLLTFGTLPYTQDPAELEGVDVAIVVAPTDDLVSDRPGGALRPARFLLAAARSTATTGAWPRRPSASACQGSKVAMMAPSRGP
jgi:arginase family enzyme